ncbi:flagellar assembly protein FliH [Geobacillus sp. G4]|uniref:Flagellar assembly protein FliH n=1 Tax=Geobacillus kaustophilus GBlys TaxID=1337888 RepID=S4NGV2_GEOKU|nr:MULTISPECIES: flagellar assembly protein FliH [Geobacillus]AMV10452.1 flagellar assembly protein FliH [Geobacillus thermoleovorans]AOL34060.1 flagellar assembly protein FliH [Geobacillus thermoleovorans]MBW7642044.1 flagellar assembly protein FliH [Geobacillus thermoleovorans]MCG6795216.1 flagellar assembly protein FliH [Geobacillus sp. YHL]ODA17265.1 flagellar assembly protein FliH [Geobacillus thermoleovorans]
MILLSNVIKAPKLAARAGKKTIVVQRHVSDLPSSVDDRQREMEAVAAAKEEAAKLRRQAEQYYESVREQLAREKEEWQREKERLMQEARARGYEDGYAAGREEALSEHRALIEQARRLAERANTEFYARIESTAEAMLEVALKAAERIIGAALEGDRNAFLPLVHQALQEVRRQTEVAVYVHPHGYEIVAEQKELLKSLFPHRVDLFIYPDDALPEYGCVVETPFGRIEASVDVQLERLREALYRRLKEGAFSELAGAS